MRLFKIKKLKDSTNEELKQEQTFDTVLSLTLILIGGGFAITITLMSTSLSGGAAAMAIFAMTVGLSAMYLIDMASVKAEMRLREEIQKLRMEAKP